MSALQEELAVVGLQGINSQVNAFLRALSGHFIITEIEGETCLHGQSSPFRKVGRTCIIAYGKKLNGFVEIVISKFSSSRIPKWKPPLKILGKFVMTVKTTDQPAAANEARYSPK